MNRGLRAGAAVLPPLGAFIAVRILFSEAAAAVGFDASRAASWFRWDSGHYLAIATTGYEYFSCARIGGRPGDVCGNAAWFPLYPWMLKPLIAFGAAPATAGAWVAGLGALGMLVALWNGFLGRHGVRGWLVLGMAAVFPGAVYQHAIFPTSLALLCLVLAGFFIVRERWALAGAFGAGVALSYVTGVLVAAPNAVAAFLRTRGLRPAVVAGGLAVCGLLLVLVIHQVLLGHWDAFYWVHRKGFQGMARPVDAFFGVVGPTFDSGSDPRARTVGAQTLTVAALVLLGIGTAVATRRRPSPIRCWAAVSAVVFWVFPLVVGSGVSLYRSEALVLPVLLLLIELPAWVLGPLLIWLVVLAEAMGRLFFTGYLV
ncbi:MAG: hypothetical protein ACXU81_05105 [Myxococcaceae bacterium]